jgi:hypothetical protein
MATQQSTGALRRTRTIPAPSDLPVVPLSSAAREALARLEAAFAGQSRVSPAVARAVTQYETAAVHARELAAKAATAQGLPAIDVRSWEFAEELMAGAKATLAAAGRLDLIEAS